MSQKAAFNSLMGLFPCHLGVRRFGVSADFWWLMGWGRGREGSFEGDGERSEGEKERQIMMRPEKCELVPRMVDGQR